MSVMEKSLPHASQVLQELKIPVTREYIATMLKGLGHEPTEERVQFVLKSGLLNKIQCTFMEQLVSELLFVGNHYECDGQIDFDEMENKTMTDFPYPQFQSGENIQLKLCGCKPTQFMFVDWTAKEDRPNGFYLAGKQHPDGTIVLLNDLAIDSINGIPFEAVTQ